MRLISWCMSAAMLITTSAQCKEKGGYWRNGDFKYPVPAADGFALVDSGERYGDWRVVGQAGNVSWTNGNYRHDGFSFPGPRPGDNWVNLAAISRTATGIMHEAVPTKIGQSYTLTFYVGNLVDPLGIYGTSSTVKVYENSTFLTAETNSDGAGSTSENWKLFKITFTADADYTSIAFINADPENDMNCGVAETILKPTSRNEIIETSGIAHDTKSEQKVLTGAHGEAGLNVVYSFTGASDGSQPRGDLLASASGLFYGTASSGGSNQNGTVFQVDTHTGVPTEQTLYSFAGGSDGRLPSAGLIEDSKGNLFGTTALGGAGNAGTVFMLSPPMNGKTDWVKTTLWSFSGTDGAQPIGSLVADRSGSGVLYGTTNDGGADGAGVVFSLTPPNNPGDSWTENVLWNLSNTWDGGHPAAALVQGASGAFYGTASTGGVYGGGVAFQLSSQDALHWAFTVLWPFTGGSDGSAPMSTLTMDPAGALFGTTEFGGTGDCAQARFPYYSAPENEFTPAYNAAYVPLGGNGCGVVFKLSPPSGEGLGWTQSRIWSFQAGYDGGNPVGDLVLDGHGALHGLTPQYGDPGPDALNQYADKGNVFTLTPPSEGGGAYTESTSVSFLYQTEGTYPRGGLTLGSDALYYASQTFGGASWVHKRKYGYGAIFSTP
jgi:uncharacterized repeat protein (TIGR03803 family)